MKIIKETALKNFEFWAGARDLANILTDEEFHEIENYFESEYPEGLTETEINDIFWFEDDLICALIGCYDVDKFYRERMNYED